MIAALIAIAAVAWVATDVLLSVRQRKPKPYLSASPLARVRCSSCGSSIVVHEATCGGNHGA